MSRVRQKILRRLEHRGKRYVAQLFRPLDRLTNRDQRANERRLVDIINAYIEAGNNVPTWMTRAALTNREQDRAGLDVVVTSTAGPLFLQVKSCPVMARQFLEKLNHRRSKGERIPRVGLIVFNDENSDLQIMADCLPILRGLYDQIQIHGLFYPVLRPVSR